jgi:DNA-binding NarL/FixJ family response regulator
MKRNVLTQRERQVIELVAQGKTDREIAEELLIARTTVIGYLRNVCQKLGASNRTAAAIKYYQQAETEVQVDM